MKRSTNFVNAVKSQVAIQLTFKSGCSKNEIRDLITLEGKRNKPGLSSAHQIIGQVIKGLKIIPEFNNIKYAYDVNEIIVG